jgi:hypothetical protein
MTGNIFFICLGIIVIALFIASFIYRGGDDEINDR